LQAKVCRLIEENFQLQQELFSVKNPIPDNISVDYNELTTIDGFQIIASSSDSIGELLKHHPPRYITSNRHHSISLTWAQQFMGDN
jgi:hypothetical protein